MKKSILFWSIMSLLALCGCSQESVDMAGEYGTTLQIGVDSRTTIGDLVDGKRHIYWSAEDAISTNGYSSTPLSAEYDGAQSASFNFEEVLQTPYKVVYPASIYKDEATISLPRIQCALAEKFDAPMYAYAESTAFEVKHLCGALRLSIRGKEKLHELKFVSFTSSNGEAVYGDFTIDYKTGVLTPTTESNAYNETRATVGKPLSTESALDLFIVLPARTYNAGCKVRVVNKYGHYQDIFTTQPITINQGGVLAMPEFEFIPTGTTFDINI